MGHPAPLLPMLIAIATKYAYPLFEALWTAGILFVLTRPGGAAVDPDEARHIPGDW